MDDAAQETLRQHLKSLTADEAKSWMRFASNKALLREYWAANYPELEPQSNGEILHCIIFDTEPTCDKGNHKNFKQFPKGYFNACQLGAECHCVKSMRSACIKAAAANMSEDAKKLRKEKQRNTMLEKYGVENAFCMPDHATKSDKTKLEKYGTTDITAIPGIMERKRQTSLLNHGVEHPSQSKQVREKTRQTVMEKYGGTIPLASAAVREKARNSMQAKYGVDNYFQSGQNQEKIKQDRLRRCGYSNPGQRHLSAATLQLLQDRDAFSAAVTNLSLEAAARKIGVSAFTIASYASAYDVKDIMKIGMGSADQFEIADWLGSMGIKVLCNVRDIIPPKEIDIYLPDYNIGIEYNGAYYHSEVTGNKKSNYHREKSIKCAEKGVKLIQICSMAYKNKPEVIKSIISAQLGLNQKIAARKCTVKAVDFAEAVSFLTENHLQNATTTGSVRLGLYYGSDLLQLLTFGKERKSLGASGDSNKWELIRMASKMGHTIVGGTSKLFAHFLKNYDPTSIISYSDLRYFTGNSLTKLGFESVGTSDPGYWYTSDYKTCHHRYNFRKQELIKNGADPALSEWEIMQALGYDRIWDCGNAKFKWTNAPKITDK